MIFRAIFSGRRPGLAHKERCRTRRALAPSLAVFYAKSTFGRRLVSIRDLKHRRRMGRQRRVKLLKDWVEDVVHGVRVHVTQS